MWLWQWLEHFRFSIGDCQQSAIIKPLQLVQHFAHWLMRWEVQHECNQWIDIRVRDFGPPGRGMIVFGYCVLWLKIHVKNWFLVCEFEFAGSRTLLWQGFDIQDIRWLLISRGLSFLVAPTWPPLVVHALHLSFSDDRIDFGQKLLITVTSPSKNGFVELPSFRPVSPIRRFSICETTAMKTKVRVHEVYIAYVYVLW